MYKISRVGMYLDYSVKSNNVQFTWRGFSDCLNQFIQDVVKHMSWLKIVNEEEMTMMFNSAKITLSRKW